MTAVADLTTIVTIFKGGVAPTNQQLLKWQTVIAPEATGTNEQKAAAALAAIKQHYVDQAKAIARNSVIGAVIAQPHLPANQAALIAVAAGDIATAESTAAGDLGG